MIIARPAFLFLFLSVVALHLPLQAQPAPKTLAEARKAFATTLTRQDKVGGEPEKPPVNLFRLVKYSSPAGELDAYVSPPPATPGKYPAIIWLVGGFSNSISEIAWAEMNPENDQSASAFRKAGLLMMYPSLRGGNENPGVLEGFYGELDDVLAAATYLAGLEYVDPKRIYLGGHSTGGTLALLVAERSYRRFRAVFAFGPVADVRVYGEENLPFDLKNDNEIILRSPGYWLNSIQSPTFVFEGTEGNIEHLRVMKQECRNPLVKFYEMTGRDHFEILAPLTKVIAEKIKADTGAEMSIDFSDAELKGNK